MSHHYIYITKTLVMAKPTRIKNEENLDSSATFCLLITTPNNTIIVQTPMTLLWRGPSNLHYHTWPKIPVNNTVNLRNVVLRTYCNIKLSQYLYFWEFEYTFYKNKILTFVSLIFLNTINIYILHINRRQTCGKLDIILLCFFWKKF
jgi:hypothetical protein